MDLDYLDLELEKLRSDGRTKSQFVNTEVASIFLKRGFALKENLQSNGVYDLVITEQGRSFIGFRKEDFRNNREEQLFEMNVRATNSSESSARAANESALSAKESVIETRKSRKYSIISTIAAVVSAAAAIVAVLKGCV